MAKKAEVKTTLKKSKVKARKEISSLEKALKAYKIERSTNWKSFKKKMKADIEKLKKASK